MGLFIGPHTRGSAAKKPRPHSPKPSRAHPSPANILEKASDQKAGDLGSSPNTAIDLLCDFRHIPQSLRDKFFQRQVEVVLEEWFSKCGPGTLRPFQGVHRVIIIFILLLRHYLRFSLSSLVNIQWHFRETT